MVKNQKVFDKKKFTHSWFTLECFRLFKREVYISLILVAFSLITVAQENYFDFLESKYREKENDGIKLTYSLQYDVNKQEIKSELYLMELFENGNLKCQVRSVYGNKNMENRFKMNFYYYSSQNSLERIESFYYYRLKKEWLSRYEYKVEYVLSGLDPSLAINTLRGGTSFKYVCYTPEYLVDTLSCVRFIDGQWHFNERIWKEETEDTLKISIRTENLDVGDSMVVERIYSKEPFKLISLHSRIKLDTLSSEIYRYDSLGYLIQSQSEYTEYPDRSGTSIYFNNSIKLEQFQEMMLKEPDVRYYLIRYQSKNQEGRSINDYSLEGLKQMFIKLSKVPL